MIHHSPLEAFEIVPTPLGKAFRYRREGYLPGLWKTYKSRVDMLLAFVAEELTLPVTHLNQQIPGAHLFKNVCGIHPAQVSRLRGAVDVAVPADWCYRLHDFSGIPLDELFKLAGHVRVPAHINARKEVK